MANGATELRNREGLKRAALPELLSGDFGQWAKESAALAKAVAYRNGKPSSGLDEKHGAVLPVGYVQQAKGVAERRMVLAGYRLADVLKGAIFR